MTCTLTPAASPTRSPSQTPKPANTKAGTGSTSGSQAASGRTAAGRKRMTMTPAQRAKLSNDTFRITGPALLSFSGGETSALMTAKVIEAHGGKLPDDVLICFANTGKEDSRTLHFVHNCETHWGHRIHWLERDGKKGFREVGFNSASRQGEPFTALLRDKRYLPNAVTRFCTIELKIRVMKHFAMSLGWDHWSNIVGLRADEMHRVARARKPNRERWTTLLPLADAGITKRDVKAYWAMQPFRLELLPFEGNCDGCFLKARPKLWEIERTSPGTLQWWADAEAEAEVASLVGKSSGTRFVTEYSYAELIQDVRRQPDLFAGGLFNDDPDMDAECGLWCGEVP